MTINPDIKTAWEAIQDKNTQQQRLMNYYDGDQPLAYTARRLRDLFQAFQQDFNANWCAVVVNAVLDRLAITGIADDTDVAAGYSEWWSEQNIDTEARLIHEYALVTGEAYATIWPEDGDGEPEFYANDPRICHIEYDGENPRQALWGCKFYEANDGTYQAIIYRPDIIEYFVTGKELDDINEPDAFELADTAENPYERIPLFRWRIHPRRLKSDLAPVQPLQDAVNKLLADMLVSSEYAAFKQRYVIGATAKQNQTLELKNAPNEIWDIGGSDAKVGEFSATDLNNYLQAIENMIAQIGSITRTPRHFFLQSGAQQASGEALIAQESPLAAKITDRQQAFAPSWREAFRFVAELRGDDPADIAPQWAPVETIQPLTKSQIFKTYRNAGLPMKAALREIGFTGQEVEQIMEEQQVEENARRESLGQMAAQAQVDFDRGGVDTDA